MPHQQLPRRKWQQVRYDFQSTYPALSKDNFCHPNTSQIQEILFHSRPGGGPHLARHNWHSSTRVVRERSSQHTTYDQQLQQLMDADEGRRGLRTPRRGDYSDWSGNQPTSRREGDFTTPPTDYIGKLRGDCTDQPVRKVGCVCVHCVVSFYVWLAQ